ncbi:MAG: hypothetical protein AMS27_08325 [Bacteroides sp. SM23_62_1]|nr:MAG: hypothetical protein AMS27_08325 [Bacteroides sp. SM23_62_1]
MKKIFYIISSIFVLTLFSTCQPQPDIEKEKENIIAVIEEERNAYFDRDISRLEAIWVQDSTSKRIFRSDQALIFLDGWSEIYANYSEDINSDIWKDYEDLKADLTGYEVYVFNNSAMAYHVIAWTGKYLGEDVGAEQIRAIHLVKIDEVWKMNFIAQLTVPSPIEEIIEDVE